MAIDSSGSKGTKCSINGNNKRCRNLYLTWCFNGICTSNKFDAVTLLIKSFGLDPIYYDAIYELCNAHFPSVYNSNISSHTMSSFGENDCASWVHVPSIDMEYNKSLDR